jgi:hypothetical protein
MREEHPSITRQLRELSPDELRQVAGGWGNGSHEDHDHKEFKKKRYYRYHRWSWDD